MQYFILKNMVQKIETGLKPCILVYVHSENAENVCLCQEESD